MQSHSLSLAHGTDTSFFLSLSLCQARGASQIFRTPDLWRLNQRIDVLTNMSILFGSILHYLYTMLFDYTITIFVWIVVLMRVSGIDSERIGVLGSVYAIPWLFHMGYLFGLPLLAQLLYQHGAWGVWKFVENLLLGSLYYLFQLRTKATAMQSGFHAGSAKYKGTGRRSEAESTRRWTTWDDAGH